MSNYSRFDKTLHYLALNSPYLRTVSFDIDCLLSSAKQFDPEECAPVFITGLARAGTTVILQALHSTGEFESLSYRDMPFILSPGIWRRLSRSFWKPGRLEGRAHGDRLQIGFESPEAFEEVFWLTFAGNDFVRESHLCPHDVDSDVLKKFRQYVANIVSSGKVSRTRNYLSKNNNNLLRLPAIRRAFPRAHILVPFRNPRDHARSLLRQHLNFCRIQKEDPFSLRYMKWLGHFEFGQDHRPFEFEPFPTRAVDSEFGHVGYWIRYWTRVYEFVLSQRQVNLAFFDFDRFCSEPKQTLTALAERLGLERAAFDHFAPQIAAPKPYSECEGVEPSTLNSALEVLEALRRSG